MVVKKARKTSVAGRVGASKKSAKKPAVKKPTAKPAVKKPAAAKPTAKKPAAASGGHVAASARPAATSGDGLPWTRRLRARVYGSHHPSPLDESPLTLELAWEKLRKIRQNPQIYPWDSEDNVDFERELQSIRTELAAPTPPPLGDTRRELLRVAVFTQENELVRPPALQWSQQHFDIAESFLSFWIARGELAVATRLAFSPMPSPGLRMVGTKRRLILGYQQTRPQDLGFENSMLCSMEPWWLMLRRAVFAAEPAAREEAWHEASGFLRTAIFSCDPEAAHEEARRQLARPAIAYGSTSLLVALRDPALALRFARAQPLNYACVTGPLAYTMVDNLGPAAEPVLRELPGHITSGAKAREALLEAADFAAS